jgi:hypothetical protein
LSTGNRHRYYTRTLRLALTADRACPVFDQQSTTSSLVTSVWADQSAYAWEERWGVPRPSKSPSVLLASPPRQFLFLLLLLPRLLLQIQLSLRLHFKYPTPTVSFTHDRPIRPEISAPLEVLPSIPHADYYPYPAYSQPKTTNYQAPSRSTFGPTPGVWDPQTGTFMSPEQYWGQSGARQ